MQSFMKRILLIFLPFSGIFLYGEPNWNTALYLNGGDWWKKRIEIKVNNLSSEEYKGRRARIRVGTKNGELNIAGTNMKELRLVDQIGKELLFNVRNQDKILEDGCITEGAEVEFPVFCPPGGKTSVTVYVDNPSALRLAERLPFDGLKIEDNFEQGSEKLPFHWHQDGENIWDTGMIHTGMRSLKMSAKPDGKSASFWRDFRGFKSGMKCSIRFMLKGENLLGGRIGFVAYPKDKTGKALKGFWTFSNTGNLNWTPLEQSFILPEGTVSITIATLLESKSGTAWFDNMEISAENIFSQPSVQLIPGKTEILSLKKHTRKKIWENAPDKWPIRMKISCLNVTKNDEKNAFFILPAGWAARKYFEPSHLKLLADGKEIPFLLLKDTLLFRVQDLQNASVKELNLYMKDEVPNVKKMKFSSSISNTFLSDYNIMEVVAPDKKLYEQFLSSPENMIQNPDFKTKDGWKLGPSFHLAKDGLFGDNKLILEQKEYKKWSITSQKHDLKPGTSYLLACWTRSLPLDGTFKTATPLRLACHVYSQKTPAKRQISGARMNHTGDGFWNLDYFILKEPAETEDTKLEYHLAADSIGKFEYDGALLLKVRIAIAGRLEYAVDPTNDTVQLWQVNSIKKIFQDDVMPPLKKKASIALAGNETENLQLAVRSRKSGKFAIQASVPENENGGKLPIPKISVIGFVPIDTINDNQFQPRKDCFRNIPETYHTQGMMYPDPVFVKNQLSLESERTSGLLLSFSAKENTPPGLYKGILKLIPEEKGIVATEFPYEIRIFNFSIPKKSKFNAVFEKRNLSRGKYLDYTAEELMRFMAEKKVTPADVYASFPVRIENKKVVCDFSHYDKMGDLFFNQLGFNRSYLPGIFFTFTWGTEPKSFLGEAAYEKGDAKKTHLRSAYKQRYQETLKLFLEHVEKKGWKEKYVCNLADEPDKSTILQLASLCDMVHEIAPDLKIYTSTWRFIPQLVGKLNLWGIGTSGTMSPEHMKMLKQRGDGLVFTIDGALCIGTPYTALERLLPVFCWKFGVDGYEFWGLDYYTYDPRLFGYHAFENHGNFVNRWPGGDGYLMYPGLNTSIRLENVRDGVEDYEYYRLLEKLVLKNGDSKGHALIRKIKDQVFLNNGGGRNSFLLMPDPESFQQLRIEIGEMVELLKKNSSSKR